MPAATRDTRIVLRQEEPMKKTLLAAIIALGAAGCTPHIRTDYFTINTEPEMEPSEERLPLTVSINNVRAPSRYQDQINFRTSEFRVGFYEYSRWVEPPAEMLRRTLCNALGRSGLFKKVDPSDIAWNPDLILQSSILSFDQVIEKNDSFAECALAMELERRDTGEPVWSKQVRVRVKQERKGEFAAAMSRAVAQAVAESIEDMKGSAALKEMGAGKESLKSPT
jgi:ABC-type uncharacterized transport system auxiliary subunit